MIAAYARTSRPGRCCGAGGFCTSRPSPPHPTWSSVSAHASCPPRPTPPNTSTASAATCGDGSICSAMHPGLPSEEAAVAVHWLCPS